MEKGEISGYIISGTIGIVTTAPLWSQFVMSLLLGATGAFGGLMVKYLWNKVRDKKAQKEDDKGDS